ncbi:MAG: hypothetical protein JWO91_1471 [Acidobacteriaceae bacterium]|nr:hypothetical protein [Acidobacteriaceae bacterium]
MTHDNNNEIKNLCALIAKEQDRHKFLELVSQLSDLLAVNEAGLKTSSSKGNNT